MYGIDWKTNMKYDFNFFYEIFDLEYTDANKICLGEALNFTKQNLVRDRITTHGQISK